MDECMDGSTACIRPNLHTCRGGFGTSKPISAVKPHVTLFLVLQLLGTKLRISLECFLWSQRNRNKQVSLLGWQLVVHSAIC